MNLVTTSKDLEFPQKHNESGIKKFGNLGLSESLICYGLNQQVKQQCGKGCLDACLREQLLLPIHSTEKDQRSKKVGTFHHSLSVPRKLASRCVDRKKAELEVGNMEVAPVVDSTTVVESDEVGSTADCMVDNVVAELGDVVGSSRLLEGEVVDSIRRRHDLVDCVVVGMVAEHIVPDDLDRCSVYRCPCARCVVGKDVVEQKLLKLLAQAQVPT